MPLYEIRFTRQSIITIEVYANREKEALARYENEDFTDIEEVEDCTNVGNTTVRLLNAPPPVV